VTPFKAHVRNGQVVFDEPADLPEGAEVEVKLVPASANAHVSAWDVFDEVGSWEGETQDELMKMLREARQAGATLREPPAF